MPNNPYPVFKVYFWQRIVTPHMAHLAEAVAAQGHRVTYVANGALSADREQMGWIAPMLKKAELLIASDSKEVSRIALWADADSIHICQGLRGNGLVRVAQRVLAKRRMKQWIIMETVDDAGFYGLLKRPLYRWLLMQRRKILQGILAIGWKTSDWLMARGSPQDRIFPFAYFLSDAIASVKRIREVAVPFRFLFVGQLVERKRVDRLIQALAFCDLHEFELVIIGDGPMRTRWESMANRALRNRVRWEGHMPIDKIPQQIANADCLVLPSRHDGWGAVVSEALMVGTPVICSDACGSAGVVRDSGVGGVFPKDNVTALSALLQEMLLKGPLQSSDRDRLTTWANCLGAGVGAEYLLNLIKFIESKGLGQRPTKPWS
jgi:glycosyltransferase involved in cell wall biosynthesis